MTRRFVTREAVSILAGIDIGSVDANVFRSLRRQLPVHRFHLNGACHNTHVRKELIM